jgi:hypothetical protein
MTIAVGHGAVHGVHLSVVTRNSRTPLASAKSLVALVHRPFAQTASLSPSLKHSQIAIYQINRHTDQSSMQPNPIPNEFDKNRVAHFGVHGGRVCSIVVIDQWDMMLFLAQRKECRASPRDPTGYTPPTRSSWTVAGELLRAGPVRIGHGAE